MRHLTEKILLALGVTSMGLLQVAVCALLSIGIWTSAEAEWYVDVYGGASITQKANVTNISSFPADLTLHDIDFATSGTVGGRAGYWFDSLPWFGVGLDVFQFWPDIKQQQNVPISGTVAGIPVTGTTNLNSLDVSVTAIALDVIRLRAQLAQSPAFPHGQLQPYFSVGPALFIARFEDTTNFAPSNQLDANTFIGVKVGVGASFLITQNMGLFGEYRFTHFRGEAELRDVTPPPTRETLKADFNTHHFIAGLTVRW
jgi:opacity protein-like surface antigen